MAHVFRSNRRKKKKKVLISKKNPSLGIVLAVIQNRLSIQPITLSILIGHSFLKNKNVSNPFMQRTRFGFFFFCLCDVLNQLLFRTDMPTESVFLKNVIALLFPINITTNLSPERKGYLKHKI